MSPRVHIRLLVVGALVVASAFAASTSPAGATTTPITVSCPSPRAQQLLNYGETITWMVGAGCTSVSFANNNNPGLEYGMVTVAGQPLAHGVNAQVSQGMQVAYTAPASGFADDFIFFSGNQAGTLAEFPIAVPSPAGSFVDNGDGSMTLTYSGGLVIVLYAEGTNCPANLELGVIPLRYVMTTFPGGLLQLPPSPVRIAVGTQAFEDDPGGPGISQIAPGSYEACLYFLRVQDAALAQSGVVRLGAPVDPVVPTFTG